MEIESRLEFVRPPAQRIPTCGTRPLLFTRLEELAPLKPNVLAF